MSDATQSPDVTSEPDLHCLAAEYALCLMTEDDRSAFAARKAEDPALFDEVVAWQEHLADLVIDEGAEVAPSPQVRKRLESRLFGGKRASFWTQVWPYGLGGIAAALVLWLAVSSGLIAPEDAASSADLVAELAPAVQGDGPVLRAGIDTMRRVIQVVQVAGEPPEGRVFELWLIAGDAAPLSLGVLDRVGPTVIDLSPAAPAIPFGALLAVSDEPPGGSPSGAPTGDLWASGPLTRS